MKILSIHSIHNIFQEKLKKAGFEIDSPIGLSREQVIAQLPNYDGLVVRSALKVDSEVLKAGTKLKFVARLGAGMENIDAIYAQANNINLINAPEGNRGAVGEHAVGMLLNLFNKLNQADAQVRQGIWKREDNRGEEIEGKTIGIIGYGNMGSAFAQKISGFGAKVIAYDKYKTGFGDQYVEEVDMETLFQLSDVVSLHVPLQHDTHYLADAKFLASFKKPIVLINTARGPVVKTEDLVKALKNNTIGGACLDVLEYEGLSFENMLSNEQNTDFQFLTKCQQVILSPHIAGWTHQSNIKMAEVLAEKIIGQFG
jgi:D-3-phosphoglycerate dehydrogenase